MAILGFHIVISLLVLTIISKLGTRLSIIQLFLTNGLYRYIAPSNQELKALLPASKTKEKANPRQRKRQRDEEEAEGFNVPKALPLRLRRYIKAEFRAHLLEEDLQKFSLFTSLHWLSIFVPLCMVVYALSETFMYIFPDNGDTNVSVFWLIIAVAFVLQVLARLTAWLVVNEDERSLLLTFGVIFFLISCIFTMWSDRIFDVHMLEAYDRFTASVDSLMVETGATEEADGKLKSPLMLYISLSVFFSCLSAMLVFPNFRYATMYTRALEFASLPGKLLLHATFLMPLFTLLLFSNVIKKYILDGPRDIVNEDQYDIIRIYFVILSILMRLFARRSHLQAHLDLSHEKVQELQKETGHVRNFQLQSMILRYYSYFNAAVLQYFSPVLLVLFFALLLKSTGDLSWLGNASTGPVKSSTEALGAIRSVFDTVVCRAVWTYAVVITTFINFSLSLIGVTYNSYFAGR